MHNTQSRLPVNDNDVITLGATIGTFEDVVFFLQLTMFDVCTTGDTAHIDTILKFLPHTRQHGCTDILHCYNDLGL